MTLNAKTFRELFPHYHEVSDGDLEEARRKADPSSNTAVPGDLPIVAQYIYWGKQVRDLVAGQGRFTGRHPPQWDDWEFGFRHGLLAALKETHDNETRRCIERILERQKVGIGRSVDGLMQPDRTDWTVDNNLMGEEG